jgi:16S rRNA processing protein RimM
MNVLVFLGRLVKPFGIKGELKFVGSYDFWDDALRSKRIIMQREVGEDVQARPVSIERARPHGDNYVVKLEGVDDRNGAEAAVGAELFFDPSTLDVALPDRELPFQIVGSRVKTEDGEVIGMISDIMFSAAHPLYEVSRESGKVLIPAVPEFVVDRDRAHGEITIRAIPGLLDD